MYIILVNYNGLADTVRCLRSLEAAGRPDTVVVDNASREDPTSTLRREFPWCEVVRNPVNGGWAGGNNVGIRHALERGAELIVLLNNDTVVSADFVRRLEAAATAHADYGIIGPVIRFMDPPHEVQTDGTVFNETTQPGFFQRKPVELAAGATPAITGVDIVNGCCMMVRAGVFRRVGLIDERFFLIHEESDFCLRARRAGFRCGVLGDALVWHKGSSSFERTGKSLQRYYDARNLYLLLRKHPKRRKAGRGPLQSRLEYFKYVYYRYAIERESSRPEAADAVLEGVCDALAGRYGPRSPRTRLAVPLVRVFFELWRNRKEKKIRV